MLNGFLHLHSECNLPFVQQLIVKGFAASQLGFSIKQSDVFWFPSLASHLPCIYFFCEFNLPFGQTDVDWFSSLATLLACNVTFYSELNLPFVQFRQMLIGFLPLEQYCGRFLLTFISLAEAQLSC